MCGRFTQQRPTSELAEIFGAEDLADTPGGRYNVAPTDEAAVVVQRDDRRAITTYRWGLVPHWSSDTRGAAKRINARSETVASSPSFRDSLGRRRCIVPVDAFYEWRREGSLRLPFAIARVDRRPLALAGLWAGWKDPETELVRRTFTILTTTPNALMAPIHDRMPVILPDDAWSTWLDPARRDQGEFQGLFRPAADGLLDAHPVERYVNDVRRDGPELIAPLGA